jgi:hypothetical protein
MNPAAARAAILITELVTFFIGTAFLSYFIAYASALAPAAGEAPPPQFPVILFEGDRAKPAPAHYHVMTWSEWEKRSAQKPHASLLLPEAAATLSLPENAKASFTAAPANDNRQSIELRWQTGSGEQLARYVAQARSIEPLYVRTLSAQTLLTSAIAAFVLSLFLGRSLRRRWLARPGFFG